MTARQIGADCLRRDITREASSMWTRTLAAEPRRRPGQGPDVFPLWADAGAASRTLFPLGTHEQAAGARAGARHHLALAEKPDSQEICFIPGGDYKRFIDGYLNEQGEQRAIPTSTSRRRTIPDRGGRAASSWPAASWRRSRGFVGVTVPVEDHPVAA